MRLATRYGRDVSTLPDNAVAEMGDSEVGEYAVVRIADEIVIDLMARACGIDLAEAERDGDIKVFAVEDVPFRPRPPAPRIG